METVCLFGAFWDHIQLRGTVAWQVTALVLGVLAVVTIGVLYVKESARLGPAPRMGMAMLRAVIVLLVAFLLTRPVWTDEDESTKTRPVGVLIDVSLSMDNK